MDLKNKLIKNILMLITLIVFSVNLYAEDEKPKFKSMHPEFYETPTRFITIVRCNDAQCNSINDDLGSKHVYYYEINKKTGKKLKLKGETINIGENLNFRGYAFTYKDFYYTMNLQSNPSLVITKKSSNKEIIEPMIEYLCKVL